MPYKRGEKLILRPMVAVLPFRSDVHGLRVLLEALDDGRYAALSGRAGQREAMYSFAADLAKLNARLAGAVLKRPLAGEKQASLDQPVVFAFEVREELEGRYDTYEWLFASAAIQLLPPYFAQCIKQIGRRVRRLPAVSAAEKMTLTP